MIIKSISTTYHLKWELIDAPNYKFTADGNCINTHTGRIIKKSLNGYSQGFHIKGNFKSVKALRTRLRKIEATELPF